MEKGSHPSLASSQSDPTHVDLFSDETVDPVYQAKAHILNQAIQEIGMGKYQVGFQQIMQFSFDNFRTFHQWYLFAVAGFGWVAYVVP